MSISIDERITGYLVRGLLRHLGYEPDSGDAVASLEVYPKTVRVTTLPLTEDGLMFVGGRDGESIAQATREHPMHWPTRSD